MYLVLRPMRLPLLPLDLGPARGVEVSQVAHPVRASKLLSRLLWGLGRGELLVRSGRPLPALLPRLSLLAHHSTLCDMVSRESLRRSAPVRDPPVFPDLRIEEQGRIVEPALVTSPVDLAPLPACCQAVESVVGGTCLVRCPPACGHGLLTTIGRIAFAPARCLGKVCRGLRTATALNGTCRDLQIATGLGKICRGLRTATALDGTCRDPQIATGLGESVRDPLLVGEVAVTACGRLSPLAVRGQRIEASEPDMSNGRVWRRLLSPRLPLSQKCLPQWLIQLCRRFRLLCRISSGFS